MAARSGAVWALAIVLSLALLIAPAIWNGFPLLQYDTGGYLARWYEGYLVPSRAVVYGLILLAGVPLSFWPVLIAQSAVTIWILALTLRAHGLGRRPLVLLAIVVTLSLLTTLPWLTAILLTDIFCGTAILGLYLLLLRGNSLGPGEQLGVVVLIAVAVATHSATLAVLTALLATAFLLFVIDRRRISLAALGHGFAALVLGAALVFAVDFAVAKRLAWTPGGFALSFGRMLQDGIVSRYLDDHCPDPKLTLCAYKDQLPHNADMWFWGSKLFDRLGRFNGLGKEMEKIALDSVLDYPWMQIRTAAADSAEQLIEVHTGEGVVSWVWHTYFIVQHYTPQLLPTMWAARQQKGEISFSAINTVQYPVGLLSMALLPAILLLAATGLLSRESGELAATIALAILANAFVCGALSGPHDRYGARVVWLATFAVIVAVGEFVTRRDPRLGAATKLP